MKHKYICIHGHFYQPPRENPWLNVVELQESAYPFHDWNHRINAECYARNGASRILDSEGRIIDIVNNYSYISFNFGPTLLEWLEKEAPDVYESILQADADSMEYFGGHGSAMAQTYNHLIMPLANERDKHTQVIWGIKDFEYRFGRKPEGMWCSETAVDVPTLEVLAAHGIKFTVLSPYQAKNVRKMGSNEWHNVEGGKVDPRRPYLCRLPSGREINLFFYDGPVSQGIAFEGLLNDGNAFYQRLKSTFDSSDKPQLMHIATDGESYGHHHRFGEMALSYCLHKIENDPDVSLVNYGLYLEKHPPAHEAEIVEPSSWSCPYGVERWRSDCGVNSGMHPGYHQKWRAPLREAFDWLRDIAGPYFEKEMKRLTRRDPWEVRNEYIEVILDRSRANVNSFITRHGGENLLHSDKIRLLKLLEMQYHCMLMYTSCGWFFDEITGIETMQDVAYAARALQLLEELTGKKYEKEFKNLLARAPSNLPEYKEGATAYDKFIKPSILDLQRVGAHYAVSSLFSDYPEESTLFSYTARSEKFEQHQAGKYRMALGKARFISEVTWEEHEVSFAVLHLGEHHLFGGVRHFASNEAYDVMRNEMQAAFDRVNVHEVIALMDKHFGTHNYSFWHLFKDEQRRVMEHVMHATFSEVETLFGKLYENHYPILTTLREMNMDLPRPLRIPTEFTLNARLRQQMEEENPNFDQLYKDKAEIERLGIKLDVVTLNFIATQRITRQLAYLQDHPHNVEEMEEAIKLLHFTKSLKLEPDLWKAQNICFVMREEHYGMCQQARLEQDEQAMHWCDTFDQLFESLGMKAFVDESQMTMYKEMVR